MNARQFTAQTAREAMALARKALGPDAVIINNRKTAQGICVTAMLESELLGLEAARDEPSSSPVVASRAADHEQPAPAAARTDDAVRRTNPVAAQALPPKSGLAPSPAMSTLSFQQFANDRRTRRQSDQDENESISVRDEAGQGVDAPIKYRSRPEAAVPAPAVRPAQEVEAPARAAPDWQSGALADSTPARAPVAGAVRPAEDMAGELTAMAAELRQMRSFISQQFSALSWVDGVRRTPGQAHVLRRLLQAGFSSQLARSLVGHLPAGTTGIEADTWLSSVLARNLTAPAWSQGVIDSGGVFALVGPTGVGKTTSVAKIAARCALDHGVDQVGLITADAYRVGAQDQLRRFGAMIGITVHTAHDSQSLHGLLGLLQNKRTVLIDTAGLGQRDTRVSALLDAVSQGPIQRLLVLSAAAQIESMREAMEAYRGNDCAGVLLTKVDEACRLGGALDTLIRFRLPLLAVANGQRVPEDWQEADPARLVEQAFSETPSDESGLPDIDLTMLMQRIDSQACASDESLAIQADVAGVL